MCTRNEFFSASLTGSRCGKTRPDTSCRPSEFARHQTSCRNGCESVHFCMTECGNYGQVGVMGVHFLQEYRKYVLSDPDGAPAFEARQTDLSAPSHSS